MNNNLNPPEANENVDVLNENEGLVTDDERTIDSSGTNDRPTRSRTGIQQLIYEKMGGFQEEKKTVRFDDDNFKNLRRNIIYLCK